MLNFEHFWKCIPEMFTGHPAFQISKYATGSNAHHSGSRSFLVTKRIDLMNSAFKPRFN